MNYMPRPGIVRAPLCGMNVLIPSREAGDQCKTILPLTLLGSIIWAGIEKDYSMEKVLEACHIFSKKPDEELTARVEDFCQKLCDKGFALPKEAAAAAADHSGHIPAAEGEAPV